MSVHEFPGAAEAERPELPGLAQQFILAVLEARV